MANAFDFMMDKPEKKNAFSFMFGDKADEPVETNSFSFMMDDNKATSEPAQSDNAFGFMMDKKPGRAKGEKDNIVFRVLDVLNAPQYGIANAIKDAVDGDDFTPLKSFYEGLTLKEKTSMSDVMTELGWEPKGFAGKAAKGVLGFAADVATDPLTYVGGIGAVTKASKLLKKAKAAKQVKWVKKLGWVDNAENVVSTFKHLDKYGKVAKGSAAYNTMKAARKAGHATKGESALIVAGRAVPGTEKIAGKIIKGIDKAADIAREAPILGDIIEKFRKLSNTIRPKNVDHMKWDKLMRLVNTSKRLSRELDMDSTTHIKELKKLIAKEGLDIKEVSEITNALELGKSVKTIDLKPLVNVSGVTKVDDVARNSIKDMPVSLSEIKAKNINEGLAKAYKRTFGKDLDTETYKHMDHVLNRRGDVAKRLSPEFKDENIGRQIQMFTGKLPNVKLDEGSYVVNLKTGKVFNGQVKNGVPQPVMTLKLKAREAIERGDIGKLSQGTIDELNDGLGVKLFSTDIVEILEGKAKDVAKITDVDTMISHSANLAYDTGKVPKGVKTRALSDEVVKALPKLDGKQYPTEIADHLDKAYDLFNNPKRKPDIIKKYDTILNAWKKTATLMNIPFHGRNAITNVVQNSLADVWDPRDYALAGKIQRYGKKNIDKLSKSERAILREFDAQGLGHTGFLSGEFGDDTIRNIHQKWNLPAKAWDKASDTGAAAGKVIEENAKLAHFIAKRNAGLSADDAAASVKKYLFDYDDVTDTEKWIKRVIPFYCVPDDTEILTRDGWKFRNSLSIGEEVLTYNINNNLSEWQVVEDIAVFDFDDKLMSIKNKRGIEFTFTKDHRFPVFDYKGDSKIIRAHEFNTGHKIPLVSPYEATDTILNEHDSALLGWIVTDGYHRYRGNSLEAVIYQSPKKHADKIRTMFAANISSESIHPDTGVICFRIKTKSLSEIKLYFKSKDDLPSIVTRLSVASLTVMYQAMMDAEGSLNAKGNQFTQKAGGVLDAFQIICRLLNKAFDIKTHKTNGCDYGYVRNRKTLCIKDIAISSKEYKGKIWCPKTQNSTWVMRQNGKTIITGNTWTRKNVPLQLEALLKTPSKQTRIVKLKNNIEVMSGPDEDRKLLPDWVKDSMPVFIGKRNGKSRYVTLDGLMPIGDLAKISDPAKEMINMLSPVLKAPVEQMANYNFFFGNKITGNDSTTVGNWVGEKDFFNTRIPGRLEHLARLFRPITEIEKFAGIINPEWNRRGANRELDEKFQRAIIGSVVYGEDTKRLKKMFKRSAGKEVANIQKQINLLRQQAQGSKNKEAIVKDIKDLRKLLRKANERKRDKIKSVR